MPRSTTPWKAVAAATFLTAGAAVAAETPTVTPPPTAAEAVETVSPAAPPAPPVIPVLRESRGISLRIAPQASRPTPAFAGAGALMAAWDPANRTFRAPTAEEAAAIAADLGRRLSGQTIGLGPLGDPAKVEMVTLDNGAVRARATADMLSAFLVSRGAGGELTETCVDGLEKATQVAAGAAHDTLPVE